MDGQLTLLRKRIKRHPSSGGSNGLHLERTAELTPLPPSPPSSIRGTSAPPSLRFDALAASPVPKDRRFIPRRVVAGAVSTLNPDDSQNSFTSQSSRPPLPRRNMAAATGSPSLAPESRSHGDYPNRRGSSVPPPRPAGSRDLSRQCQEDECSEAGDYDDCDSQCSRPGSARRNLDSPRLEITRPVAPSPEPDEFEGLDSGEICGVDIPPRVMFRLMSIMPTSMLPAFRRVCSSVNKVLSRRLAKEPGLQKALDHFLETRRLKSKRVWVVVRARPLDDGLGCLSFDRNKVTVRDQKGVDSSYFFDRCFGGSSTQDEIEQYIGGQLMHHTMNGEHICLLAYGQTGSGKTHTMFGSLDPGSASQGLAFRCLNRLANLLRSRRAKDVPAIELSFLEVYNDGLFDLLDGQKALPKQRSSEQHCVPMGLTRRRCAIDDMERQVCAWLREGAATRTVGKTVFNPRSSRSHAVVMLTVCWGQSRKNRETRVYLVDLAGSERAGMYALAPEQLKEGEHINLSLSALGRVVTALASGKTEHVPYRDSALTWLLKDAISGANARVCMVAAVHPSHPAETGSTLRYARQYSTLQSSSSALVAKLSKEAREIQRRLDKCKAAFEMACSGDEHGIPWTKETLRGSTHCQPRVNANIKQVFAAHPYLEWTPQHQSKAATRGKRVDISAIGCARSFVQVPVPRCAEDRPDGRLTQEAVRISQQKNGDTSERCVEVEFEGKHGRPSVILWYPESAIEMVQPPKPVLDVFMKLEACESELARKREELHKAKKGESAKQEDWMATAGVKAK